jgi:hypothetical protein
MIWPISNNETGMRMDPRRPRGPDAPLSIQESIPNLVNVMLSQKGAPGRQFLDYLGRTVLW